MIVLLSLEWVEMVKMNLHKAGESVVQDATNGCEAAINLIQRLIEKVMKLLPLPLKITPVASAVLPRSRLPFPLAKVEAI